MSVELGLEAVGKLLLIAGAGLALLGLLFILGGRIPLFGRLPGDIFIQKGGFSLYFPIVTFILLSLALTIVLNIVVRFLGK